MNLVMQLSFNLHAFIWEDDKRLHLAILDYSLL